MTSTPTPSDPRDEHESTTAAVGDADGDPTADPGPTHEADPAPTQAADPAPADNRWAPTAMQEPAHEPAPTPELVEPAPAAPTAPPIVDDAQGATSITGSSPVTGSAVLPPTEAPAPVETPVSVPNADPEPVPDADLETVPDPDPYPAPATAVAPQVVYVPSPTPPRKKGNRGMGVGIALASTPIFAAVFAAISLLFVAIANGGIVASQAVEFFLTPSYWLPIVAFAVFYVLLALIVNRAGWWAHVLGGFVVAVLVYLVFVLSTAITAEALGVPLGQVQQLLLQQLTNPLAFAAAIAAREVPIWVGSLVARRGRTVKSRNVEAREAYDRELEESREARPATR